MFERREYQHEAAAYAIDSMARGGRPILCSPCGSGKSYIEALVAKHALENDKTFCVLTPREELLNQMHETLASVCGVGNVGVLKSGQHWRRELPIQVVSWPTLVSRTARSTAWFPMSDICAIDEAHLSVSPKMAERVLPYFEQRSETFGVTATPGRKSGRGLGSFYTEIKHVITVRQLIRDQKLAPLEYWGGKLADLSKIKSQHGDYNQKQLGQAMAPLVGDVIDNWGRLASDRHTLVFAVNVPHCEALVERFQRAGVSAAPLHIHMAPEQRARVVRDFKARRIQVLVNISIASYGFDAPTVDCVVLARPTKSLVLHIQMLGRGMRTADGKEFGMVLDHAGNVDRLGKAEDLYRWRLGSSAGASTNWSRHKDNPKRTEEDKTYTCKNEVCGHIFARSRVCPKCGTEIPLPKQDVEAIDADLVRISERRAKRKSGDWPDDRTLIQMIRGYANENGYKLTWADHRFKDMTGRQPPNGFNPPRKPSIRVANKLRSLQIAFSKGRRRVG